MKYLILILFFLSACSCGRNSDDNSTQNTLPPATQTGANTIGCLVNGEVFLPHQNNPTGPSATHCHYQFVNNEWNFSLGYFNDKQNPLRSIGIFGNGIKLHSNIIYPLGKNNGIGNASLYGYYGKNGTPSFYTDNISTGELKITKLDSINYIISGTFWFDAINSNGQKVQIRDGRFDMQYTP